MSNLRQAAQQALEALGQDNPAGRTATINALQKALAEPHDPVAYDGWVLREVLFDNGEPVGHRAPEQEPVAWLFNDLTWTPIKAMADDHPQNIPVYTAPPQRKPLTEEHPLMVFAKECVLGAYSEKELADAANRAIKYAHGIKGDA